MTGKILEKITVENRRKFEVDISAYPSGVYYISFLGSNQQAVTEQVVLVK